MANGGIRVPNDSRQPKVIECLRVHPWVTLEAMADMLGISYPTMAGEIKKLGRRMPIERRKIAGRPGTKDVWAYAFANVIYAHDPIDCAHLNELAHQSRSEQDTNDLQKQAVERHRASKKLRRGLHLNRTD